MIYTLHQELTDATLTDATFEVGEKRMAIRIARGAAKRLGPTSDVYAMVVCKDGLAIATIKTGAKMGA